MALPSSGTITAAMINVELGRASTATMSMNGAAERTLAGKPSGTISFSNFHGKTNIQNGTWYYSLGQELYVYLDDWDQNLYFYYGGNVGTFIGWMSFPPLDAHGRWYYDNGTYRWTCGITVMSTGADEYWYRINRTLTGVVPTTTGH